MAVSLTSWLILRYTIAAERQDTSLYYIGIIIFLLLSQKVPTVTRTVSIYLNFPPRFDSIRLAATLRVNLLERDGDLRYLRTYNHSITTSISMDGCVGTQLVVIYPSDTPSFLNSPTFLLQLTFHATSPSD
jgi:hypothetical protein